MVVGGDILEADNLFPRVLQPHLQTNKGSGLMTLVHNVVSNNNKG